MTFVGDSTNLIHVYGWGASGKSVLLTLIDDHEEILPIHIHDKITSDLCKLPAIIDNTSIIQNIKSTLITGYKNFKLLSHIGHFNVIMSASKGDTLSIPFNLNFRNFEDNWMKSISSTNYTAQNIAKQIYASFYQNLNNSNYSNSKSQKCKYICTMANPRNHNLDRMFTVYPNSKFVLIKRDILKIFYSRSNRPQLNGFKQNYLKRNFFYQVINGDVCRLNLLYLKFDKLCNLNPSQYITIDFDDLVCNSQSVVAKFYKFLEIKPIAFNNLPTIYGVPIIKDGKSYIGKVNDPKIKFSFSYILIFIIVCLFKHKYTCIIYLILLKYLKCFVNVIKR